MRDLYERETLNDAIRLLSENGYVVIKLNKRQLEDGKECEDCDFEGDCCGCSCSICIMQS